MAQQLLVSGTGETGATARAKINDNFTELYLNEQNCLKLSNVTSAQVFTLPANSLPQRIAMKNLQNIGGVDVKIGSTVGADDILTSTHFTAYFEILSPKINLTDNYATSPTIIYITLSATVDIRVDLLANYF